MLTPRKSSSFVRRKFNIGAKAAGSLSINIAPVSSFSVEILPLSKLEKKESGIHISVCLDVLNLVPPTLSCMISPLPAPAKPAPFPAILPSKDSCSEHRLLLLLLPPAAAPESREPGGGGGAGGANGGSSEASGPGKGRPARSWPGRLSGAVPRSPVRRPEKAAASPHPLPDSSRRSPGPRLP